MCLLFFFFFSLLLKTTTIFSFHLLPVLFSAIYYFFLVFSVFFYILLETLTNSLFIHFPSYFSASFFFFVFPPSLLLLETRHEFSFHFPSFSLYVVSAPPSHAASSSPRRTSSLPPVFLPCLSRFSHANLFRISFFLIPSCPFLLHYYFCFLILPISVSEFPFVVILSYCLFSLLVFIFPRPLLL